MNGRYTFLLVCLLLTLPISSSRTTNNGEETLVNITLADGLAGETVYRVMSDHGGRTWIATSSGISVYNGKQLRKVSFAPLTFDICETADRTIYAATEEGLFCLPYGGKAFRRILPEIERPEALLADSNIVYIGGREGLHIYDGKQLKTIPIGAGKKGLDNIVRQCVKGDDGLIWFLSRFDICSYDPRTGKIQSYGFASQMKVRTALSRFAKTGNKCYVGTKTNGFFVYDLSTRVAKHMEGVGNIVTTVEASADGYICVATDGSGAYMIDPATDQIVKHFTMTDSFSAVAKREESGERSVVCDNLPSNALYCYYRDQNGVDWFGFVRCGLAYNYRCGQFFQPLNTPALRSEGINVRTFCLQPDHYLIGTQNGCWLVSNKGQRASFYTPEELGGSIVNSIVWYRGEYYIGTFDGGLRILNPRTEELRKPQLVPKLATMSIGTIAVSPDSSLWIGCTDGVFILTPSSPSALSTPFTVRNFTEQNSHIVGGNIISITFDHENNAWLTGATGCSFYSKKSGEVVRDAFPQGFFNNVPWMKSSLGHDGTVFLRSGPRTFYTSPDMVDFGEFSLPVAFTDKWSRSFVDDQNGHYWLSSEKGLFCFSYDLQHWLQLGQGAGLQGALINDVQLVPEVKKRGSLFVATSQGLFYADPKNLPGFISDSTYQVQLCEIRQGSDLLSMEEELRVNEEHRLRTSWNFLSEVLQVQAVLPDYTLQASRLYEWRLGDGEWHVVQDGAPIILRHLFLGRHQLQVRLAGVLGTTATYTISVMPSVWAIFEALLLLVALVLLFLWRKDHSEKQFLRSERNEIEDALVEVEEQLQDISLTNDVSSLNPEKYQKVKLDEEECARIVTQLKEYIEKEKVYTNAELKMKDLADVLRLSPSKLSQVFNLYLKENYYEFINRYRLEEFKRLIEKGEYKRYTITALSEQCGFRKSSFFSTFRRIEGMTPAEYLRKHGVKPINT